MLVIPAIDLKDGQCVRLRSGKKEDVTIYSSEPWKIAQKWQAAGAQILHVIDLDGAFSGKPINLAALQKIRQTVEIPIQFGGGIRSYSDIQKMLDLGIDRLILGTAVVSSPEWIQQIVQNFGDKIIIAIDARNGKIATEGWVQLSDESPITFARKLSEQGIRRVIYTDISRDGMLVGPNFDMTKEIAIQSNLKIIAAGGISSLADLEKLKQLEKFGIEGAIVGRALYEGQIDLAQAIKCVSLTSYRGCIKS
ncbi:MAG TPA: 1-(5-phosphoribosyl)-5-[(5-phosphoribosylamino)methylideneamino]imidazole-4-carboxamide isomerase [Bacteroidetes bacterium]|nr:1-(5-phosphoribosyl)-5-[(5-phosphoribosylamino)methylideneamino]imidazole-4-carboxamide isomerase [Bacteroidota bacterium]